MKNNANRLSARMKAVYDMVDESTVAADIGCDHGFVSIALIEGNKCEHVIACDVNEGPLKAAAENIRRSGLSDKIETRPGDGLHKISSCDRVDTIIIAGMGGQLMTRILSEGLEIIKGAAQLVLQPQSELFLVRRFLRENGFYIEKETFLEDMGKYYWVMDARPGASEPSDENEGLFDTYSGYLLKNKDTLLRTYLEKSLEIKRGYLKNIAEADQGKLREEIGLIEKALTFYEA